MGTGFNLSMVYKSSYTNDLEANRQYVRQKGYDPDKHIKVPAICWFTNMDHSLRHENIDLFKTYTKEEYPRYDNYDAINVDKTADIPSDYDGVMGVPISFFGKYNSDQFEILGATESEGKGFSNGLWKEESGVAQALVNGEKVYKRIFIRKKQ